MARVVKNSDQDITIESEGVVLKEAIELSFGGDHLAPHVWVKLPLKVYLDRGAEKSG